MHNGQQEGGVSVKGCRIGSISEAAVGGKVFGNLVRFAEVVSENDKTRLPEKSRSRLLRPGVVCGAGKCKLAVGAQAHAGSGGERFAGSVQQVCER